ncbi:MAG: hypothetical protein ACO2PM_25365 [Pyrobaculum sp.]
MAYQVGGAEPPDIAFQPFLRFYRSNTTSKSRWRWLSFQPFLRFYKFDPATMRARMAQVLQPFLRF